MKTRGLFRSVGLFLCLAMLLSLAGPGLADGNTDAASRLGQMQELSAGLADEPADIPSGGVAGDCGEGLTWKLSEDGVLTVTGTGDMWDFGWNTMPWNAYRDGIRSVEIGEGVTSVGAYAFYSTRSLSSVSLSSKVKKIGNLAFANTGLRSIELPNGLTSIGDSAFSSCMSLSSVVIPASVKQIGVSAFNFCMNLSSVSFEDGVESIGDSAFYYCRALTSVVLPPSVKHVGEQVFGYCSRLTKILAANENQSYKSVDGVLFDKAGTTLIAYPGGKNGDYTIPDGVTAIAPYAFYGCNSLAGIAVPSSVTSIGSFAFAGCTSLTQIQVNSGNADYKSIDGVLFDKAGTTLLVFPSGKTGAYTVPNGVTTIGERAFSSSRASSVTLPDSVKSIEARAFENCTTLTAVSFGNQLETIGAFAFHYCTGLPSVTIPDSVTVIEEAAFWGCRGLETAEIGNGVKTIGNDAFSDCGKLSSVTIGTGVTNLGYSVFRDCKALADVYYGGSRAMWNGVVILAGSDPLRSAQMHYGMEESDETILAKGQCGGDAFWTLRSDGSVTISGTGDMWDYKLEKSPLAQYRAEILSVIIEEGITSVGNHFFASCQNLVSVSIAPSVMRIGECAFAWCESLASAGIPTSVTQIGAAAYKGCTSLADASLPDGLTGIGAAAFAGCGSLSSVSIPASVSQIGITAFGACENLTQILVDAGNANYKSVDGVLFDKSGKTLLACPGGIDGAYEIPEGVTDIGELAFYSCTKLASVSIPESMTKADAAAFSECIALADVYFAGSRAQWDAVIIEEDNRSLLEASFHFAGTSAALIVSSANTQPGGTVTLHVSLKEPVTVKSLMLYDFTYDDTALTLTDAAWNLSGALIADWDPGDGSAVAAFSENTLVEGVIFTMTFTLGEDVEGEFEVGLRPMLKIRNENGSESEIPVSLTPGTITSASYIRGDMNEDGMVTTDDAIYLLRHVMMPDRYPVRQPADVNGDALITSDDAIYLLRHVLQPEKYPLF